MDLRCLALAVAVLVIAPDRGQLLSDDESRNASPAFEELFRGAQQLRREAVAADADAWSPLYSQVTVDITREFAAKVGGMGEGQGKPIASGNNYTVARCQTYACGKVGPTGACSATTICRSTPTAGCQNKVYTAGCSATGFCNGKPFNGGQTYGCGPQFNTPTVGCQTYGCGTKQGR